MSHLTPIKITYTNYRGETAERTITPQRIWHGSTEHHHEEQWLIRAFDHDKQAVRDFAFKDVYGQLHGPFGWLNGHRALSEDSWTLENDPMENSEEYFAVPLYALRDPFKEIGRDFDGKPANVLTKREAALAAIAKRLIKWDTDFPINCQNGYAGLKELDRIIADAKTALGDAPQPNREEL